MRPIVLASALTLSSAFAQDNQVPLNELLRDGLYAEEVGRDSEAAARNYQQIVSRFESQSLVAVNALYRLAEIRRGENRKDEAIALYQKIVTTFPNTDPQAKFSRERLAALGAVTPVAEVSPSSAAEGVSEDEAKELKRLTDLAAASPDRLKPLAEIDRVAREGWIRVAGFLIDRLEGQSQQDCLNRGLAAAAETGQLALCKFLLVKGADANGEKDGSTLSRAVWADRVEVVKLLLAKGANPNLAPENSREPNNGARAVDYQSLGGALHAAAYRGNVPLIRLLIESGADVSLPAPSSTYTPLHLLLRSSAKDNVEILRLLLDKGAKLDAVIAPKDSSGEAIEGITPLFVALQYAKPETVKILLDRGASAKGPDLLVLAVQSGEPVEKVRLLLASGANAKLAPNGESSLLERAASANATPALMQLLLDSGAPVVADWKTSGFATSNQEARKLLLERFLFPDWFAQPRIRVIGPDQSASYYANSSWRSMKPSADSTFPVVTDKEKGDALRSLAEILLGMGGYGKSYIQQFHTAESVTLYRKDDKGGFTRTTFRFDSPDPYPEPAWGDILWFTPDPERQKRGTNPNWPSATRWELMKHLSVPVEIEIDGHKQSAEIRGDCLSYDPTRLVLPWQSAGYVVSKLTGQNPLLKNQPFLVYRKGWPQPIQLGSWTGEGYGFMLQKDDRLVARTSQDPDEIAASRKEEILLTSPGLWFNVRFAATSDATPPTLLQAIASAYAGNPGLKKYNNPLDLLAIGAERLPETLLPHPDFSRIRIRRLAGDGAAPDLTVNLDQAAAGCTDQTSAEDARKFDVELLPGDIVEIPVIEGKAGESWKGFSEAQNFLFVKALSCRVQFSDGSQQILRDVTFAPPRIIDTGTGLLPVPLGEGSPVLNARDVLGGNIDGDQIVKLTRGNQSESKSIGKIFLRDGDRIEMKSSDLSPRIQPQIVVPPGQPAVPNPPVLPRPNRQRVVPPPTPAPPSR